MIAEAVTNVVSPADGLCARGAISCYRHARRFESGVETGCSEVSLHTVKKLVLLFLIGVVVVGDGNAPAQSPLQLQRSLSDYLQQAVKQGDVVGAQVYVGGRGAASAGSVNIGSLRLESPDLVTDETVFCIGSCSKPIASAVVFTLLDQNRLQLNMPAGRYIPTLDAPRIVTGQQTRSPTLRELLSHRAGIYSQHNRPTKEQIVAIRDFSQTLEDSVAMIVDQPRRVFKIALWTLSKPGNAVASKRVGERIDMLFQQGRQ